MPVEARQTRARQSKRVSLAQQQNSSCPDAGEDEKVVDEGALEVLREKNRCTCCLLPSVSQTELIPERAPIMSELVACGKRWYYNQSCELTRLCLTNVHGPSAKSGRELQQE